MAAANVNQRAKTLCQAFLFNQIRETERMYARVSACECEHFGGKDCVCTPSLNNDDTTGNDTSRDLRNGSDTICEADDSHVEVGKGSAEAKPTAEPKDCVDTVEGSKTSSDEARSWGIGNDSSQTSEVRTRKDSMVSEENFQTGVKPRDNKSVRAKVVDWSRRMILSSGSVVQIKPLIKQTSFDEQSYDGLRNPYVIIVNNVHFSGMPNPRNGADTDEENLKRFLRLANFNSVEFHHNLKKDEMCEVFERSRKNPDLVKHDGLMCFLMSHGSHKGILTADRLHVQVDDITALFQGDECPCLATKPKLFFIQSCRGNEDDQGYSIVPRGASIVADSDLDSQVPVKLPSDTDFLVVYSTTKGKSSYRQYTVDGDWMQSHMASMGSWFIACLVQVMVVYSHQEDLLTMLTRVNKAMSELYTDQGFKQVSCYLSMLTKKVFFPTIQKDSIYKKKESDSEVN